MWTVMDIKKLWPIFRWVFCVAPPLSLTKIKLIFSGLIKSISEMLFMVFFDYFIFFRFQIKNFPIISTIHRTSQKNTICSEWSSHTFDHLFHYTQDRKRVNSIRCIQYFFRDSIQLMKILFSFRERYWRRRFVDAWRKSTTESWHFTWAKSETRSVHQESVNGYQPLNSNGPNHFAPFWVPFLWYSNPPNTVVGESTFKKFEQ